MSWTWIRAIGGVVCVLIGLVWIGQGTNLMPGSVMSGQAMWAIIGLLVLIVGAWLLWSVARERRTIRAPR
jgi:glucose dehydrogenase